MTNEEAQKMTLDVFLALARETILRVYPDIKKLDLEYVVGDGKDGTFNVYFLEGKNLDLINAVFHTTSPEDGMYICRYRTADWGLHSV